MAKNSPWVQIIKSIATPLSFFVLTLLIIESTLALVLVKAGFSETTRWSGFLWMVGIFVGVVGFVVLMTVFNPKNLLYGKEEHSSPQIAPAALRDQIEELIFKNVKEDSLKK